MRVGHIFLGAGALMLLAGVGAFPGFGQAQLASGRIPQQIIVNGQPANGAFVPGTAGGMQTFTCASPQRYATPDASTQGWACYDQRTATYLLNALPPGQLQSVPRSAPLPAALPQASAVVYGPSYPYTGFPGFGFAQPRLSGKVKIDTKLKDVNVYVDGGFAGRIRELKKFSLPAGNHDLELRDSHGQTIFKEKVQVIPRRTLEVKPVTD